MACRVQFGRVHPKLANLLWRLLHHEILSLDHYYIGYLYLDKFEAIYILICLSNVLPKSSTTSNLPYRPLYPRLAKLPVAIRSLRRLVDKPLYKSNVTRRLRRRLSRRSSERPSRRRPRKSRITRTMPGHS